MRKKWTLGFLGFLGFLGIPGIITQDWLDMTWLVWFVWFMHFLPEKQKSITIFSHGFGVKKDARGLFTELSANLKNTKSILFDYNEIDEKNNTITIKPFSEQVKILKQKVEEIKLKNPNAKINLICHSQGSRIAGLAQLNGINKTILISPSTDIGVEKMLKRYQDNPKTEINFNGITKLPRTDNSTTIIPPEYWQERKNETSPIELYNQLAKITELTIIKPKQDEVLGDTSFAGLDPKIKIIELEGDHGFHNNRTKLIEVIKKIIL